MIPRHAYTIADELTSALEDMCYLVNKYAPYAPHELLQDGLLEPFLQAVEKPRFH